MELAMTASAVLGGHLEIGDADPGLGGSLGWGGRATAALRPLPFASGQYAEWSSLRLDAELLRVEADPEPADELRARLCGAWLLEVCADATWLRGGGATGYYGGLSVGGALSILE